jgi:hypothetical protein
LCIAELLCIKTELVLLEGGPGAAAAAEELFQQAIDWARYTGFRDLVVINEDRVQPSRGFGAHSHANMELLAGANWERLKLATLGILIDTPLQPRHGPSTGWHDGEAGFSSLLCVGEVGLSGHGLFLNLGQIAQEHAAFPGSAASVPGDARIPSGTQPQLVISSALVGASACGGFGCRARTYNPPLGSPTDGFERRRAI